MELHKCNDCQASLETSGLWRQFNTPQCLHCTARLIKQIKTLRTPTSDEIRVRQRAVLAAAIDYGYSEQQVRDLVKTGPWVQPPTEPSKGKRK